MHRDILEEKCEINNREIQEVDEGFTQEFELFKEECKPELMRLFDLELQINEILLKHEIEELPLPNFTKSLVSHISEYILESDSPSEYYKASLFELAKRVVLEPEQTERIFCAFAVSKLKPSFQDKMYLTEIAGEDLEYLAEKYLPKTEFELVTSE